jgi:hypothetical protein
VALVPMRDANRLGWLQPSWFSRTIEVSSDNSLAAILRLQNWSRSCDATCADGMWRFAMQGFFGRTVKLTSLPSGAPVASFSWKFRGGIVRFDEGDVFEWKALGFWSGGRAFLTPSGFPVLTFKPKMFAFKSRGEITIHREYANIPQLPMLVMLGVNLVLTEQRRRRA